MQSLMYQLCKGVAYCHGRGVIHRDLKHHIFQLLYTLSYDSEAMKQKQNKQSRNHKLVWFKLNDTFFVMKLALAKQIKEELIRIMDIPGGLIVVKGYWLTSQNTFVPLSLPRVLVPQMTRSCSHFRSRSVRDYCYLRRASLRRNFV